MTQCSNVTLAHKLQGKLLLTVGEMDKNVDPASTMQVVNALIKADKDFELIVFPNGGHGSGSSPYGERRRNDFFVRTLLANEPNGRRPKQLPLPNRNNSLPSQMAHLPFPICHLPIAIYHLPFAISSGSATLYRLSLSLLPACTIISPPSAPRLSPICYRLSAILGPGSSAASSPVAFRLLTA